MGATQNKSESLDKGLQRYPTKVWNVDLNTVERRLSELIKTRGGSDK